MIHRIEDYALIGDCRSAALVSGSGSIDWCCWPRFDSPSVFARILDWRRGGHFSIEPAIPYRSSQRYVDHTNVLVTRFETDSGRAELTDLMPVMSDGEKRRRLLPFREILRRVSVIDGEVPFRLEFAPRPGFGRERSKLFSKGASLVECRTSGAVLLLGGNAPLAADEDMAISEFAIRAGETRMFSLTYSDEDPAVRPLTGPPGEEKVQLSIALWRDWVRAIRYRGPHPEAIERSALALKLMIYAPSGAMIAAPTTSLPESIGGERNWDYRYCWLRDASFAAHALYQLGFQDEGDSYCRWLLHATSLTHPGLHTMYDVYGRTSLREKTLTQFEGHRQSAPVRIGNDAYRQHQLDVYGELMLALDYHVKNSDTLDRDTQKLVRQIGDLVSRIWTEPDHGIWEVRSGKFQHVHGKVMAWAALDCVIRLRETGRIRGDHSAWEQARDSIREAILSRGFSKRLGTFVGVFDREHLDASLLTLPISGFLPADDPRMLSTIEVIRRVLGNGDLICRYRGFEDGLAGNEGAFLACSFWMVEALALAGERAEAAALFDRLIRRANEVGLYSEEIDPETGTFLGNFPQAFSHLALINAALALQESL